MLRQSKEPNRDEERSALIARLLGLLRIGCIGGWLLLLLLLLLRRIGSIGARRRCILRSICLRLRLLLLLRRVG